jgi:hypothetical protein
MSDPEPKDPKYPMPMLLRLKAKMKGKKESK